MKYNEIGNENKINEIDIKKMLVSQRPITRIRQKFFWEKMKIHIQKFIQGCLQCQIKKLVRVQTKNPKVITDTPTTAFE